MKQKDMKLGAEVLFRMQKDPRLLLRVGRVMRIPLTQRLVSLESRDWEGKPFTTALDPRGIRPMPANPRYFMVTPDTPQEDLLDAAHWVRYEERYRIAVTSAANWRVLEPILRERKRLMIGGILHLRDVVPAAWLEGVLEPPKHATTNEPPEAERVY